MDIDAVRNVPPAIPAAAPQAQRTAERADTAPERTSGSGVNLGEKFSKQDTRQTDHQPEEGACARMLEAAIEQANRQLLNADRRLEASVHESTNRIMVRVIDTYADEVIMEIPPEQTLDLFAKVLEMAGILLDERR
jgi:flagellar protein FlaG